MAKPAAPARPSTDARARASGWVRGESLWVDDISQVENGWAGAPFPLVSSSGPLYLGDTVNAAFRFAAIQMDKIRPCEDLTYGCVNVACGTRTPITWPTWGHIRQICLDISDADHPWSFFKAGEKAAYKICRSIRSKQKHVWRPFGIHRVDYGTDFARGRCFFGSSRRPTL